MATLYLAINASLYLSLAIWMTVDPWKTATAVGYKSLSAGGRSEFLVIYGGLQLGLALFYGITAATPALHRFGIVFSLCLYAPLVVYRTITLIRFLPSRRATWAVSALELALLLGAIGIAFQYRT
jgi:hypothetical protein